MFITIKISFALKYYKNSILIVLLLFADIYDLLKYVYKICTRFTSYILESNIKCKNNVLGIYTSQVVNNISIITLLEIDKYYLKYFFKIIEILIYK